MVQEQRSWDDFKAELNLELRAHISADLKKELREELVAVLRNIQHDIGELQRQINEINSNLKIKGDHSHPEYVTIASWKDNIDIIIKKINRIECSTGTRKFR